MILEFTWPSPQSTVKLVTGAEDSGKVTVSAGKVVFQMVTNGEFEETTKNGCNHNVQILNLGQAARTT